MVTRAHPPLSLSVLISVHGSRTVAASSARGNRLDDEYASTKRRRLHPSPLLIYPSTPHTNSPIFSRAKPSIKTMGYGRLCSPEPLPSESTESKSLQRTQLLPGLQPRLRLLLVLLLAGILLVALAASAAVLAMLARTRSYPSGSPPNRHPARAISRACQPTRFRALCENSLAAFPGATKATSSRDLVHVSLNVTTQHVVRALDGAAAVAGVAMGPGARAAYDDCMELLEASLDQVSLSLAAVSTSSSPSKLGGAGAEDVLTWLSAALTNQDTCHEGLEAAGDAHVKGQMEGHLKDLSEMVSNSLAIFTAASNSQDFAGVPIQNKKRRRLMSAYDDDDDHNGVEFPKWVTRGDRRLLEAPAAAKIQADMVVSPDGANGTYKKIADAIKATPDYSSRRIVIYVKAGQYNENIKVGRKKTNLMFVGDGKGKTVVAGGRSVADNYTTYHTATFAASGSGLILKDLAIENWAGPAKHQAVALRVSADHAVVYRCNIIGYQDTLYVHSQRQFFRECDVYGTVDFIFGNAAVVLQNCSLWARRPIDGQMNTVTAQNRKDPNQNTGISVHACRVVAAPDLEPAKEAHPTYLGRPWKEYARTVYMESYIGDHVEAAGWLEWNATSALDTLYYGEYRNYGPGGAVERRVGWPGFRVIKSPEEAGRFTVAQFIYGASWLPATGVAYAAGLSE